MVWNGSNALFSEGKAIDRVISWVPSIPVVCEKMALGMLPPMQGI